MTGLLGITESEHLESILSLRDLTLASELAKTACLGDSDGSMDDIVSPKIELDIDAEAIAQQDDELRQQFDKMRAGMLDSLPREVRDESLQASRDDALSQLSSIRTDSAASEVSSPPPRPDFPAMYSVVKKRDIGMLATVRAALGWLSALSVSLYKSFSCGACVWARRALNGQKRRFPAPPSRCWRRSTPTTWRRPLHPPWPA